MNPRISDFFGIKINMYYGDHNPPHFHVKYNEFECFMSIKNVKILEGNLPNKIENLVISWAILYEEKLLENWKLAINEKPLKPIKPIKPILPFIK